jgi:predicted TIM-barrel fold metal-dependent hydrolase
VGGLFRGGRGIRAAGTLREVLNAVALVDHHAHGILRAPPGTLDEFRGLFSESEHPRQWPHVATGMTYRRAIRALADFFGIEPTEEADLAAGPGFDRLESAVFAHRLSIDPLEYASLLLQATNTEVLLIDDGFPEPSVSVEWAELGELAACESRPIMRIERVFGESGADGVARAVASARADGFVALKTVAAYRGGLDLNVPDVRAGLEAALEANAADPLPIQFHTGFGDADLTLPLADPGLLKPLIERYDGTPFVLLHCYPFVREAGWLAHVYPNVFFDLSLTIPHVSRPAAALGEALELAPASKLLYASDAARTPELYLLAATWWRDTLARVLPELLEDPADAEATARLILRDNARALYDL